MKVIILTSSLHGTAAHHLPKILESKSCEVAMVVYSRGQVAKKSGYYSRKFRKMLKIGILGTINGFRMRRWFGENVNKYLNTTNLEEICAKNNIPFYSVPQTNGEDTKALFQNTHADLGISLGNSYIAKSLFSIPKYGMINIHHEVLPEYQNAQSVIWQLYNNSAKTGYTIHKIDQHVDAGEILYQKEIPIIFENKLSETVSHSIAALLEASADGLVHVLQNFDALAADARKQGDGNKYTTPGFRQYLRMKRNFNRMKTNRKR